MIQGEILNITKPEINGLFIIKVENNANFIKVNQLLIALFIQRNNFKTIILLMSKIYHMIRK